MYALHRVHLSAVQRRACIRAVNKAGSSTRLGRRALVLLHADLDATQHAATDEQIAIMVGVTSRTVARVRSSFDHHGFDIALHGRPRDDSCPSKLTAVQEIRLLALLCTPPPAGYPRWTIRTLAEGLRQFPDMPRVSRELVRRILNRHDASASDPGCVHEAEAS